MSSHGLERCPRCGSEEIRGGYAEGIHDRYCGRCRLLEYRRGTDPDYVEWVQRWEKTGEERRVAELERERLRASRETAARPVPPPPPSREQQEALLEEAYLRWTTGPADPQEASLVRAVLDQPDADEPRHAYARWLEQRDDRRGDLIRMQLEHRRLCHEVAARTLVRPLAKEIDAMIDAHRQRWAEPFEQLVKLEVIERYRFHRGFVEWVELDAAAFLRHAEKLFRLAPVRHLRLLDVGGAAAELFASPYLARVVSLDLERNHLGDADVEALARSPHVGGLVWLDLSFNDIGLPGIEALAASRGLPRLRYLGLSNNHAGDPTDEIATEGFHILALNRSLLGIELEQRHGELPWLHSREIGWSWTPTLDELT